MADEWKSVAVKLDFPEVVLLKIFSYLGIKELLRAGVVCSHWNILIRSDVLWKKFIPKLPGFVPPKKSSIYETVAEMWRSSIRIGKERWLANPLTELMRYESRLRKAEYHNYGKMNSNTTLYVRLNPCYEFTTKGKDVENEDMNKICREIWNRFSEKKDDYLMMESHEHAMNCAALQTRKEAMESILHSIEPEWFLEGLELTPYEIEEHGDLVVNNTVTLNQEKVEEDDIGDITCTQKATSSIFGSFFDSTAWRKKVNKRLPVHVYHQIKSLFADNSQDFIEYYLSDGCFNENFQFAYSLLVSDTAAFFIKQYYDL